MLGEWEQLRKLHLIDDLWVGAQERRGFATLRITNNAKPHKFLAEVIGSVDEIQKVQGQYPRICDAFFR